MQIHKRSSYISLASMAPRKTGARKRKTEEPLGGQKGGEDTQEKQAEETVDRRRKDRGNKKYIGAHVGIQGRP